MHTLLILALGSAAGVAVEPVARGVALQRRLAHSDWAHYEFHPNMSSCSQEWCQSPKKYGGQYEYDCWAGAKHDSGDGPCECSQGDAYETGNSAYQDHRNRPPQLVYECEFDTRCAL